MALPEGALERVCKHLGHLEQPNLRAQLTHSKPNLRIFQIETNKSVSLHHGILWQLMRED